MKLKKLNLPKFNLKRGNLAKRKAVVLSGAIVILILITVVGLFAMNKSREVAKVDCVGVTNSAKELISQNKYQEAYKTLGAKSENCGKPLDDSAKRDPAKTQQYVELLEFNSNTAVAAYGSGDKAQAKVYADEGIKIREQMTLEQENKIPPEKRDEFNDSLIKMYKIQHGLYRIHEGPTQ